MEPDPACQGGGPAAAGGCAGALAQDRAAHRRPGRCDSPSLLEIYEQVKPLDVEKVRQQLAKWRGKAAADRQRISG